MADLFHKLFLDLFLANPLQGFFTALALLFFVLMIYTFYTCDGSPLAQVRKRFCTGKRHCRVGRKFFRLLPKDIS